jgi:hypothetical protein
MIVDPFRWVLINSKSRKRKTRFPRLLPENVLVETSDSAISRSLEKQTVSNHQTQTVLPPLVNLM